MNLILLYDVALFNRRSHQALGCEIWVFHGNLVLYESMFGWLDLQIVPIKLVFIAII